MDVEIRKILPEEKHVLEQLLIDYFLEIDTTYIDQNGRLIYPYLDSYFLDLNRLASFVLVNNQICGFVLINDFIVNTDFNANFSVAEFNIILEMRKLGIGKKVAYHFFDLLNGKWEVRQSKSNVVAVKFWEQVINSYTNGQCDLTETKDEVIRCFTT